MTTKIELLPLPDGNVAHLIAGQDAEIKALRAEVDWLRDALEEIRNRSWTGVMRSNKFELEVALANICLFVDVVLWKGNSNG